MDDDIFLECELPGVIVVGADGKSAYELACEHGFRGTEADYLQSIIGPRGVGIERMYQLEKSETDEGKNVFRFILTDGRKVDLCIRNGSKGLQGTQGIQGAHGKSAYEYAVEGGYQGSEEEFYKKMAESEMFASNIIFPTGLKTTYPIGKVQLVNGMGTLVEPGGTLADFFNVFIDEKNPTTVQPSVSLSFPQADAYEVGEKITPRYSTSLNPGSYTYGPATGVTVESWEVTDSKGNTADTASGSFPEIQVTDGMSYTITAKAEHTAGADPVTNTGNKYEAGKIPAGSKKKTSGAVTGYRNTFYGTLTEKGTLDSGEIRKLSTSGGALADGSKFTVAIPVGAMCVVIAYPATLRDLTSVKDVNGMSAEIASSFIKSTVDVAGANGYTAKSYKVYTLPFAEANDTANTFNVTI